MDSKIADPQFADFERYDFSLAEDSPAFVVGFKPIDTSNVGLYGDSKWVEAPRKIECEPLDVAYAHR